MNFLLEILSEEIPARMQAAAADQLRDRFVSALKAAGLAHGAVTADATPRRLWLIAEDVAAASEGSAEELKGPRADAPAQAIDGFLKKTGLTRDQLEERDTGKAVVLFAVLRREGRSAAAILAEVIPQIIRDFAWPKSMRWGAASATTASARWVRPLVGLVALLDGNVVACEAHGIAAGRITQGHRIHAPGPLAIDSADTYVAQLRAAHVIASSAERRQIIAARAAELAAEAGLALIPDDGLVAENAGLTEWPVPLLGRFDPDFLSVPREVIVLTMRTNQKYFALSDAAGALAPAFICVANLEASDGGTAIVNGNSRVLSARLSDARFFWEQDLATVRAGGLRAFLPKLENIVFHEKLGTVADKVERVAKLAKWLCESGAVLADPVQAERAAQLAKADLVSATVGEFPELQGQIGRYLALAIGVDPAVADAIRDHYKPAGQSDDVPTAPVSVAVALADKLDTLMGFVAANELPTGSKDPFGLRRAMLGNIRVIQKNSIRCAFSSALDRAYDFFIEKAPKYGFLKSSSVFSDPARPDHQYISNWIVDDLYNPEKSLIVVDPAHSHVSGWVHVEALDSYLASFMDGAPMMRADAKFYLMDFLADRLKVQQREAGVRHDLIDAVFALGSEDDLVRLLARVKALQAFVETDDGANLLAGYKRAANILKAAEKDSPLPAREGPGEGAERSEASAGAAGFGLGEPSPDPSLAGRGEEMALANALDAALPQAQAAVAEERFTDAMAALAALRGPVDGFFEGVMVNDPDPAVRARRLALLARFRDAVHGVADFSRIEG